MPKIDVWRPKIKIPKRIREAAAAFKLRQHWTGPLSLRNQVTVELSRICGRDALISDGHCGWHDDQHIDNQYSLLFVLRNDTDSYVRSFRQPAVVDQPAGTAILLDIWHRHSLAHAKGIKAPMGVWLALCKDLDQPWSREQCEIYLKEWITEVQDAA